MRKAIFLDRDGVLNQTIWRFGKPRAPYTMEDFSLLPGVPEAIKLFKENGYTLIVVTNQPDVARGWVSQAAVDDVNQKLKEILPLDDLKACFHTEKDNCSCRKPEPGMLLEGARDWGINTSESYMIGDRESDIMAGKRAGCRTVLIRNSDETFNIKPDLEFESLLEAAHFILK